MAGKVCRLTDLGLISGQECANVYDFWNEDGLADPADLSGAFIADVLPTMTPFQSGAATHVQVNTQIIAPTKDLTVERPVSPVVTGALAGTVTLPVTVTYSIKWSLGPTIDLAGATPAWHIKKGGKHLGGATDSCVLSGGQYNGTQDAHLQAYIAALLGLSAENWQLCVYSDGTKAKVPHSAGLALVTGGIIKGFGTQVSRKPGRGA